MTEAREVNRILAQKYDYGRYVGLYLAHELNGEVTHVVKDLKWVPEPDKHVWTPPHLTIRPKTAQRLFDDLWACGFRPQATEGSADQTEALSAHLKDMRAIASKKLGVELP